MKVKKYIIQELGYNLYICFGDIKDFKAFYGNVCGDKLARKDMCQSGISISIGDDIFCMVHSDCEHDYVDVMIHEIAHAMAEVFTYMGEKIHFNSEFWANYISYYVREGIAFLEEIGATKNLKNNPDFKD